MRLLTSVIIGLLLLPSSAMAIPYAEVGVVSPPPATMTAGQTYAVSVTMFNTGTTTWYPGFTKLGSQSPQDNTVWGLGRVDIDQQVEPGDGYTFNFSITAPEQPGQYAWQWRMLNEGVEWFGIATSTTNVAVDVPPSPAELQDVTAAVESPSLDPAPPSLVAPGGFNTPLSCLAFGFGARGTYAGYSTLRIRLYINGSQILNQVFGVPPNVPYTHTARTTVVPSETARSFRCTADLISPQGSTLRTIDRTTVIPGNGPSYTEVLIKTFIAKEWELVPPPAVVDGSRGPNDYSIAAGDNRSFSLDDQRFRTRVWGWLNNPYFDRNVLRAATPHFAGQSEAYDGLTSVDLNYPGSIWDAPLLPVAKADTVYGYPMKLSWGAASMSRVGCSELSFIGLSGSRAGIRMRCTHEANMPLVTPSPDIDWRYNIDFWFGDDNIWVSIWSSCIDYFPSHELYVSRRSIVQSAESYGVLGGLAPICLKSVSVTNQPVFQ